MAKVLSGHGCFQKYLYDRDRAARPACVHCEAEMDDAEHTVFSCPFWEPARAELTLAVGRLIIPEDVMYLLCGPVLNELPDDHTRSMMLMAAARSHSDLFCMMVETIMRQKEDLERQRLGRVGQVKTVDDDPWLGR